MANFEAGRVTWVGEFDGKRIKTALDKMRSNVEVTAKGIEKGLNNALSKGASRASKKLAKDFAQATDSVAKLETQIQGLKDSGAIQLTTEAKRLESQFEKANTKADNLKVSLEELAKSGGLRQQTKEAKQLEKEMQPAIQRYQEAEAKLQEIQELNKGRRIGKFSEASARQELAEAGAELDNLREKYSALQREGKATQLTSTAKSLYEQYKTASHEAENLNQKIQELKASGGAYQDNPQLAKLETQLAKAKAKANETAVALQELGNGKRITVKGIVGKLKGAFDKIKEHSKKLNDTVGKTANSGFKNFIKWGLGIRSVFFAYRKLRKAIGEGFGNLTNVDGGLKDQLDNLRASANLLKNALGAMIAPIFKVIEPALTSLAETVAGVANTIGKLIAALTGKGFYMAKKSFTGLADGAGQASGAAKELKRQLMGFDQIQKLDDVADSLSGSGGGTSYSDMFELADVDEGTSKWAELIKRSWAEADFTEIGSIVGNKIGTALENIKWDNIQAKASKIAKSTATFINGFFGEESIWSGISKTISGGLNTAITTLDSFATNINTTQIGKGITSSLQTAFNNVKWTDLGHALGESVKKIFDFGTGLLDGVDWRSLPNDIWRALKKAFEGVDWNGLADSIAGFLSTAISSAFKLLQGIGQWAIELFTAIKNGIANYFSGKIEECGGDIVAGLLQGIWDAIVGIGTWIYDHVFVPIWDGIKEAFGINSPSKKMKEIGGWLIDGLKEGLSNIWDSVCGIFEGLVEGIGNFFKDPVGTIKVAVDEGVEKAKDLWDGFKDSEAVKTLKEKGKSVINGVKSVWDKIKSGTATKTVKEKGGSTVSSFLKNTWNKLVNATATKKIAGTQDKSFKTALDNWNRLKSGSASMKLKAETTPSYRQAVTNHNQMTGSNISYNTIPRATTYAQGGIPKLGTLFWAGEKGPEIVASAKNGSEVMNLSQIGQVISSTVTSALHKITPPQLAFINRQTATLEQQQNEASIVKLLTAILVAVQSNDNDVYFDTVKVTNEIVKQINRDIRATGVSPIIY